MASKYQSFPSPCVCLCGPSSGWSFFTRRSCGPSHRLSTSRRPTANGGGAVLQEARVWVWRGGAGGGEDWRRCGGGGQPSSTTPPPSLAQAAAILQAALDAGSSKWSYASGPCAARAALCDYAALLRKYREKRVTAARKEFCAWEAKEEAAGRDTTNVSPPDWDAVVQRTVHTGAGKVESCVRSTVGAAWEAAAARDALVAGLK